MVSLDPTPSELEPAEPSLQRWHRVEDLTVEVTGHRGRIYYLTATGRTAELVATAAWSGQPIVSTFQEAPASGCGALGEHASMAINNCMPDAATGGEAVDLLTGGESSSVHLFDTYVEVLCSF